MMNTFLHRKFAWVSAALLLHSSPAVAGQDRNSPETLRGYIIQSKYMRTVTP